MAGLNQAINVCSKYCCNVITANHEELPTGMEYLPPTFDGGPISPKLSSVGSWSNDDHTPPPSPSFYREMESRFANDDVSVGTEATMNDTTMDISLDDCNGTGEDIEMIYDSPSRSATVVSNKINRTIQVSHHGDDNDNAPAPTSDLNSARLNASQGSNIERISCQSNTQCISPTVNDVLLGRGGLTNKHPGNKRFREMIGRRKREYKSLPRHRYALKTQFAKNAMNEVHEYGGRFLERVNDKSDSHWMVAKEIKARKKCSQALRE